MYTLQEFIRFTKGWEYVIAICAISVFIVFWRLLAGRSAPEQVREEEHVNAGAPAREEERVAVGAGSRK